MRQVLDFARLRWLGWLLAAAVALSGCRAREDVSVPPPARSGATAGPSAGEAPRAGAVPSALLELERAIQTEKLTPTPAHAEVPRLAFGRGLFAQLTRDALRVFHSADFRQLASVPLEQPRVLVPLADGALLAVGQRTSLRFEPGASAAVVAPRPVLLPGVELLPDAIDAGRVWVFDARTGAERLPTLAGYRIDAAGLALPQVEVSPALEAPSGGVLGRTREGVWLYVTQGRAQRLSPGGLSLAELKLPELPQLVRVLPARRLDQSYFLDEQGGISKAVVTPVFRLLTRVELGGTPFSAAVGDDGRLLAVVIRLPGTGHRFQLKLYDAQLKLLASPSLPEDAVTGRDDWVRVVTENQTVAVSRYEPRVAVGGPSRVLVFDAQGQRIFSIPSM